MSYTPNIPNLTDFTALSQKQILANFQAINNAYGVDHVSLTANADVGKHKTLTFRVLTADAATGVDQSALYTKIISSVPQLFFKSSNNQIPIQLTNSNLNTAQTGAPDNVQSSFLAGPFTIYFGYVIDAVDGQPITLLPASTLIYVGLTTYLAGNVKVGIASTAAPTNISGNTFNISYTTTQFMGTIEPNPIPVLIKPTIYYTAIGQ